MLTQSRRHRAMRRIVLLAATIGLTAAGLVAATPAQAAEPVDGCGDTSYTVTPNTSGTLNISEDEHTVIVGTSHRTLTFDVDTDEGCDYWEIYVGGSAAASIAHATWFRPTVAVRAAALDNIDAGANYPILVRARANPSSRWYNTHDSITFLRATSWKRSFNASPEPVTYDGTVKTKGTLYRANWDTATYQRYPFRRTLLLRNGVPTWVTHGNSLAVSSRNVTHVTSDAVYRQMYAGNSTSGASRSNADFVPVAIVDED